MWLLALTLILVLVLILIVTVHIVAILSLFNLLLGGLLYILHASASSLDKSIFFLNDGPRKKEKTRIKKQKNVSNYFDDTNINKSTR